MRLVVVAGDREYLTPKAIPRDHMLAVLRRIEPEAYLPDFGWASAAERSPTPALPAVDLAVEYACDTTPATGTAFVLLPFESTSGGHTDDRVQAFVEAASAALGTHAVGSLHLCLSRNTQAVLARLAAAHGPRVGGARESIEIAPMFSGDSEADHETIEALARNYTQAVLERGEMIVGNRGLFTAMGRAAVVTQWLDQNRLLLRPDLTPERVLAELQPGGELFELLCRPLAHPAEGGTLAAHAPRAAKE